MPIQRKAALISLFVSCIVLALKAIAYVQTHSTGILSDALETTVNVITALVAVIVLKYAIQPADEDHPYGHGKIEYFSAAFEGGVIFFAALAIIFESTRSLLKGHELSQIESGAFFIVLASVINFITGLYLLKVGKKYNSETLKASGSHLMSDVKTTIGVLVGLLIYKLTGMSWIDATIGILVGSLLLFEAYQIITKNLGGLLDQVDLESLKELCLKMNLHLEPAIIDIHNLRVIRSGSFHHIDAHVVVPQYYDIKVVHDLMHNFEQKVVADYSFDGEFAFHTDPCEQRYCSICSLPECSIRKNNFIQRRKLDYQSVTRSPQDP